ncbi:MAG: hypothetical protein A2138_05460 [Deltaproteobacteria bacterium RBG_16_71_12]|nr:MAG: hypothetical protein A2138_05460 [Deltaproteobacteria bacterium RBG_16_71_12]
MLAASSACGLAPGERFGRAGARRGVLRVHVPAPVIEWDPPRAHEGLERFVALQLFATLLDDEGRPRLAQSVRDDDGGGTVVVTLDAAARFSDGVAIDAGAVVWSWRRALLRSTGAADLAPFSAIANGQALAEGRLLRVARSTTGRTAPYASLGDAPDAAPALELAAGTMVRVVDTNERRPCCGGSVALRREPNHGDALGALNVNDVGAIIGARTVKGSRFLLLRTSSGASGWAEERTLAMQVPPASLLRVVDRGDGSAALRVGPEDDAPARVPLADGEVVEVLGEAEGFLQAVDLRTGQMGFVARRALEALRGEQQWLEVEPVGVGPPAPARAWVPLRDLAFDPSALGVRAIDAVTIEIECASEPASVLRALAHPALAPVPPHAIASRGRAWIDAAAIVTTGPFAPATSTSERLVLVRSSTSVELERARLERVELVAVDDMIAALHLYRAGELDVLLALPADLAPALARAQDHAPSAGGGGLIAPEVRGLSLDRLDLRGVEVVPP